MTHLVKSKKPAYSLLELLISISILAIIMVMLHTVLLNLANISQKSLARSLVREQLGDVLQRMANDIRHANKVFSCAGSGTSATCNLELKSTVVWKGCEQDGVLGVCRQDGDGNVLYRTSANIRLEKLEFEEVFTTSNNVTQTNILVTLVGSHTNETFEVTNVIQQVTLVTRNYLIN